MSSNVIEKEITVGELKEIYNNNEYIIELDTPDGYQNIINWYDKGIMPLISISTDNHTTKCAENHLIQLSNENWVLAKNINVGDEIITKTGIETVVSKTDAGMEFCYDFEIDHENHRYWGDGISSHNSGKSFFVSGNLVRYCRQNDILVVLLDSEDAIDRSWIKALGVDPDDTNGIVRLPVASPDDCATTINMFMKQYAETYRDVPEEERQKVLFVIDSLGMLSTTIEMDQFEKGDMKGDMGRKPKQLKALVTQCIRLFNGWPIGMVATNHTYKSQDMFNPDDVISGGGGFIFASSIVIALNKLKLKIDEDGNKTKEVRGIRSKAKVVKSRFSKPFEEVEIHIPYDTGMDPYSGLFDMFEKVNFLVKEGNKYKFVDKDGVEHKYYKKEWEKNNTLMDMLMEEYEIHGESGQVGFGEDIIDENE